MWGRTIYDYKYGHADEDGGCSMWRFVKGTPGLKKAKYLVQIEWKQLLKGLQGNSLPAFLIWFVGCPILQHLVPT